MNYDRTDLLDRLASEYVLGTLTGRARRRFERIRTALPAADRAVRDWERRLAPLASVVPPTVPPAAVWQAVERRIGGAPERPVARGWFAWLGPSLGVAFGVVATLGIVRLYPTAVVPVDEIVQSRGTLPASYVGLLADADGAPVVLASSTRHGRTMHVKILRKVEVPAGKVLQLWALPQTGAPFPLGVVPAEGKASFTMADTSEKLLSAVPRLAVSLEDAPVAAGAAPSSPYVLSGHCVKLW